MEGRKLVFIARLIEVRKHDYSLLHSARDQYLTADQLLASFACTVVIIGVMTQLMGNWYWLGAGWALYFFTPAICLSTIICICAGIGLFANRRPNDVHWHLVLTLLWLELVGGVANFGASPPL